MKYINKIYKNRKNIRVVYSNLNKKAVFFNPKNDKILYGNEISYYLWQELFVENKNIEKIIKRLCMKYKLDHKILIRDLEIFLEKLYINLINGGIQ